MHNTLRAVIYVRVSTDDQADYGTGLETQELESRRIAERIGATVVSVESDPGISGTILHRPGIERALRMLETGQADALIAYNAGRLGRKTLVTLRVWERIHEAGARLFLCDMGEVTEENELMLTVSGGFAQQEWREIRKRMMAGQRRRAEQGRQPSRAYVPFGYRIIQNGEAGPNGEESGQYVVLEERARIVRDMFARIASGSTLRGLCNWLQSQGVETPRPQMATKEVTFWTPGTCKRILNNPIYKGFALWGKTETRKVNGRRVLIETATEKQIRIPAPAIVDAELWEQAQQAMQNSLKGVRNDRKYLFVGLMRCPVCGRRCQSQRSPDRKTKSGRSLSHTYYLCVDYANSRNPARSVCHPKSYREDVVCQAMERIFRSMEDNPEFLDAAYLKYRESKGSNIAQADHIAILEALKELDAREMSTARAYANVLQIGARGEVFETLLKEIAEERKRLETRQAATERAMEEGTREIDEDISATAAAYAADMLEVLTSDTLTPAEKNARLSRVVTEIRPEEEQFRVIFKPFRQGSTFVPVAYALALALRVP